jgi:hypothetical protein
VNRRKGIHAPIARTLLARRAEARWETLASLARIDDCDARLCAKLAKIRKVEWRRERRVVKRMLREVAA